MGEEGLSMGISRTVIKLQRRQQLIYRAFWSRHYTLNMFWMEVQGPDICTTHWSLEGDWLRNKSVSLVDTQQPAIVWESTVSNRTEKFGLQKTSGGRTQHPLRNPIKGPCSCSENALCKYTLTCNKTLFWQHMAIIWWVIFFILHFSGFLTNQLLHNSKIPQRCLWAFYGESKKGPRGKGCVSSALL